MQLNIKFDWTNIKWKTRKQDARTYFLTQKYSK